MNRIEQAFHDKKALIAFITGGDPDLDATKELMLTMQQAGADLIEIGIPFSDPIAEGPVMQKANIRALTGGTTTKALFSMLKEARGNMRIPIVLITYFNSIFKFGTEEFMRNCKEAGVDGVIVPDLPYEEKGELTDSAKKYGVIYISMITPDEKERAVMIAKEAHGFLCCIPSHGVTETPDQIQSGFERFMADIKNAADIPCVINYGVESPEQAKKMAQASNGVIVDDAIVNLIAKHGKNSVKPIMRLIDALKKAIT